LFTFVSIERNSIMSVPCQMFVYTFVSQSTSELINLHVFQFTWQIKKSMDTVIGYTILVTSYF